MLTYTKLIKLNIDELFDIEITTPPSNYRTAVFYLRRAAQNKSQLRSPYAGALSSGYRKFLRAKAKSHRDLAKELLQKK